MPKPITVVLTRDECGIYEIVTDADTPVRVLTLATDRTVADDPDATVTDHGLARADALSRALVQATIGLLASVD